MLHATQGTNHNRRTYGLFVCSVFVLAGLFQAGCQSGPPPSHITVLPSPGATRTTPTDSLARTIRQADKPVAVYFLKDGCFGCTIFTPRFNNVSRDFKDLAEFVMVDVGDVPNAIRDYNIRATPTVVTFVNGEEKDRFVGAKSSGAFADMIKDAMQYPER